jgi:hypothetical protein
MRSGSGPALMLALAGGSVDCLGESTSGNEDASASILRFLRGAMLVAVRLFGVLVVLVVTLKAVSWAIEAKGLEAGAQTAAHQL